MKWQIRLIKWRKKISERLGAPEIFFIFAGHTESQLCESFLKISES
jgi:hypothetical protein